MDTERKSRTDIEAEVVELRSHVVELTDLLTEHAQSVKDLTLNVQNLTKVVQDLVLTDEARRVRIGIAECAGEGMIKGRIQRDREEKC